MPTYDYACDACRHQFEQFQSIKAKALRKCPKCGQLKLRRLIGTGGALLFKGSGFYITDYRSEGYKSAAKADGGAPAGKGEGKGESKPAGGADKPATPSKTEPKTPKPGKSSD